VLFAFVGWPVRSWSAARDIAAAIALDLWRENEEFRGLMSRPISLLVAALTAAFFAAFFVYPIAQTLKGAFFDADDHFTLLYAAEVCRDPIYVEGLRNAFLIGIASTAGAFILAVPLAWLADHFDFAGKKTLSALLLAPMILPPFVGAIGVRKILGQEGALNALLADCGLLRGGQTIDWLGSHRFWGIVALNALHLYPVLYLNVAAALANVDPAMEEAAENLGSTGWRKFRRITLPLILPGVFAGGTIVFIWAFTELGVPLIFDYTRVTSVQIFYGIRDIGTNPFPYALVAVMLAATLLLYAASRLLAGRRVDDLAMISKGGSSAGPRPFQTIGITPCCRTRGPWTISGPPSATA
jgi:iron(III) transport system permease protein